jgi:hypothetical protein
MPRPQGGTPLLPKPYAEDRAGDARMPAVSSTKATMQSPGHRDWRHTVHVDPDNQAAVAAVRRYAEAPKRIRSRLFNAYPEFHGVTDLMKAVRSGPPPRLPREGRSSTGIEYSVHGTGCRMTDEHGQEVDVDLAGDDQTEAFDGWRIKNFLDQDSSEGVSVDQLLQACAHLASLGELREVRPGRWYALPPITRLGYG